MIKIIMKSTLLFLCFSSFSMNNEVEEKIDTGFFYENLIQNFCEEISNKINFIGEKNKSIFYIKDNGFFIFHITIPSDKTIIYFTKKMSENYENIFSDLYNLKKYSLFIDSNNNVLSKSLNNQFVYAHDYYVMQGSLEDMKKILKEKFKYFSALEVRTIKNNSFKNLNEVDDFEHWIDIFSTDEYFNKDDYKKRAMQQIKYFLLCKNIRLHLGVKFIEYCKKYEPIATNMTYYNDSAMTFLLPYEKISDKNSMSSFRKKMIFESLNTAPEEIKTVIILSTKEDVKFFESLNMKKMRTLHQYNSY